MPKWLETIILSPWFVLAAFAIGIAGILATLVTYWKSKARRDLSYATNSRCLLDHRESPDTKLVVTYDGRNISTFTLTRLVVWNRGTESLRKTDVASANPIVLKLLDGEILEARIIKTSSETNGFSMRREDSSTYSILFEYIDPHEGMVAEVRHTASTGKNLEVVGKLIGVHEICRRVEPDPLIFFEAAPKFLRPRGSRQSIGWSLLIAIMIVGAGISAISRQLISTGGEALPIGIITVISLATTLSLFLWLAYRLFKPSLPRDLVGAYFHERS